MKSHYGAPIGLTNALSNGTIPDPLQPPLPQDWGSQPRPKTAIAIISGTAKATDCKFGRYIHRPILTQAHEKNWRTGNVDVSRDCQKFLRSTSISRKGKATKFKFCTRIHSINRKKSPLKMSGKVPVGVEIFRALIINGESRGYLCDSSAFLFLARCRNIFLVKMSQPPRKMGPYTYATADLFTKSRTDKLQGIRTSAFTPAAHIQNSA